MEKAEKSGKNHRVKHHDVMFKGSIGLLETVGTIIICLLFYAHKLCKATGVYS